MIAILSDDSSLGLRKGSLQWVNHEDSPYPTQYVMFVFFIRMIDSAQAYDEEQVGEAVKESGVPREEVFIVSKVHPRFLGFEETLKSVEESLTKLKVCKGLQISALLLFSMKCS